MKITNKRRIYLIDKSFQLGFVFRFCAVVIVSSLLIGALLYFFSMSSTTVAINNTKVSIKATSEYILPIVLFTIIIVAFFSSVVLFFMALIVSHRIAGPVYRLRKEIEMFKAGDLTRSFIIRNKDHLKELAKSLSVMSDVLRVKHEELKKNTDRLKTYLKEHNYTIPVEDRERFTDILSEIDSTLSYFKV